MPGEGRDLHGHPRPRRSGPPGPGPGRARTAPQAATEQGALLLTGTAEMGRVGKLALFADDAGHTMVRNPTELIVRESTAPPAEG
jgi:hypothetical protein